MDAPELNAGPQCAPKLASRWWRLVAVLIDGLIGLAFAVPIYWYFHVWDDIWAGVQPSLGFQMIAGTFFFATFVAINFRLLEKRGQTIGKWFVGIAIVGIDGANKGAVRLITYRFVPMMVFPLVPLLGSLFSIADMIAIFGKERRCLHDRIAGTRVIDMEFA